MDSILKRGEGHIGDVQTNTWVPPTPEDFERIREIGHDAISPLNQALESRLPFRQLLAILNVLKCPFSEVTPISSGQKYDDMIALFPNAAIRSFQMWASALGSLLSALRSSNCVGSSFSLFGVE
jgi:hypothetical protein